jgi:hypothetical protein
MIAVRIQSLGKSSDPEAKSQSLQWKTSNCLENRIISDVRLKDKNSVDLLF